MGVSVMRQLPMPSPDDLIQLGELLEELVDSQPENRTALDIWTRRAERVEAFLKETEGLSDAVPHAVWHFLADADIRMIDRAYRAAQLSEIQPTLQTLKAGESPVAAA